MLTVSEATKIDKTIKVLQEELNEVNSILLSLDCGETSPEELPIAPKFYITKKERIENLIWVYKVEKRMTDKKTENASDKNSD